MGAWRSDRSWRLQQRAVGVRARAWIGRSDEAVSEVVGDTVQGISLSVANFSDKTLFSH